MVCSDAWAQIYTVLTNNNTYKDSLYARCADAGWDPSNPTEFNRCKEIISDITSWVTGVTASETLLMRQTLMAESIFHALQETSPDTAVQILASRNAGNAMIASGIMTNQWIPVFKAIMTAVAFGMIPFVMIFLPTPVFPKALLWTIGSLLLITVWGVVDALLHQFAMDYSKIVFKEISDHQLGLTSIMNMATSSQKTLAAFGAIRASGMMLSMGFTSLLIKFGGHAMVHLAGSLQGTVTGTATGASSAAYTPEGRAGEMSRLTAAPSVMAAAGKFDYQTIANAPTLSHLTQIEAARQKIDYFGGGDVWTTALRLGGANAYDAGRNVGAAMGGGWNIQNSENKSRIEEAGKIGATTQTERTALTLANALGYKYNDPNAALKFLGEFQAGNRALTKEQAEALNKYYGIKNSKFGFQEGMTIQYEVDRDGHLRNVRGSMQLKEDMRVATANSPQGAGYRLRAGGKYEVFAGEDGQFSSKFSGIFHDLGGHDDPQYGHTGEISMQNGQVIRAKGEGGYDMEYQMKTISEADDGIKFKNSYQALSNDENTWMKSADAQLLRNYYNPKAGKLDDRARLGLVENLVADTRMYIQETGTSQNQASGHLDANLGLHFGAEVGRRVEGEVGFNVLVAKVGAGVNYRDRIGLDFNANAGAGISKASIDKQEVNLMAAGYNQAILRAEAKTFQEGGTQDDFLRNLYKELNPLLKKVDNALHKDENNYGADVPLTYVKNIAANVGDKVGGTLKNMFTSNEQPLPELPEDARKKLGLDNTLSDKVNLDHFPTREELNRVLGNGRPFPTEGLNRVLGNGEPGIDIAQSGTKNTEEPNTAQKSTNDGKGKDDNKKKS